MPPAPIDRTVRSADGTAIALTTSGVGPALVLVAGPFDDRTSDVQIGLADALASSFSVTRYDRRGRGASGNTAPYAVQREVEDLRAVIDAVTAADETTTDTGDGARVVALCAGAGLVLHALAEEAPIDSAVLYEPSYRPGTTPEREGSEHISTLRELVDRGRRAAAVSYFLVRVLGMPKLAPVLARFDRRTWRRLLAGASTLPHDAMVMDGFALEPEQFAGIDRPVLVVAGGNSTDWLKIAAQDTVHAIRGSEHTVLQGQTHLVDPAALAGAAERFFTANRRRA